MEAQTKMEMSGDKPYVKRIMLYTLAKYIPVLYTSYITNLDIGD